MKIKNCFYCLDKVDKLEEQKQDLERQLKGLNKQMKVDSSKPFVLSFYYMNQSGTHRVKHIKLYNICSWKCNSFYMYHKWVLNNQYEFI